MCNFCDENELKLKEIEISLRQKDITLKKIIYGTCMKNRRWPMSLWMISLQNLISVCITPARKINGNCDTYLNYFKSLLHNSVKYWLIVLKIEFDLEIPIIMINLFAKSHFSICEENEHKLPVDWYKISFLLRRGYKYIFIWHNRPIIMTKQI